MDTPAENICVQIKKYKIMASRFVEADDDC